jgi:CysZ protein
MRNLARELALTLLLLLLGLIPVFGPFSPILIFLVQSYYAGYGNMDYTMERHFRIRETVHFVRKHRGLALGNGIVFMGLLLTGLGFLIALPLGAVAATEETLKAISKPSSRLSK